MVKSKKRLLRVALLATSIVAIAACGSSKSTTTPTSASSGGTSGSGGTTATTTGTSTAPASGGNAAYQAAIAATLQSEKGTNTQVSPTSRPAAKNKFIVVISSGQSSSSSQIPSDAAVAAAKAHGWRVDLYDAKLNPSLYSPLIRQAIAAGAQGIIADAIDCQAAKEAFQQAVTKKIVIIPMYAFKVTAVNIISSEWTGWAAIDTMNSIFDGQKPAVSGIGWTIADTTHHLPKARSFNPPVDFKAEYKKAWGVG